MTKEARLKRQRPSLGSAIVLAGVVGFAVLPILGCQHPATVTAREPPIAVSEAARAQPTFDTPALPPNPCGADQEPVMVSRGQWVCKQVSASTPQASNEPHYPVSTTDFGSYTTSQPQQAAAVPGASQENPAGRQEATPPAGEQAAIARLEKLGLPAIKVAWSEQTVLEEKCFNLVGTEVPCDGAAAIVKQSNAYLDVAANTSNAAPVPASCTFLNSFSEKVDPLGKLASPVRLASRTSHAFSLRTQVADLSMLKYFRVLCSVSIDELMKVSAVPADLVPLVQGYRRIAVESFHELRSTSSPTRRFYLVK